MLDLDFVGLEFETGKPACLVEYKNEQAPLGDRKQLAYQALIELGDGYRTGIPVLAARYASDFSWFRVTPLNKKAKELVPRQTVMSEADWVALLFRIRGRQIPPLLLGTLQNGC